MKEYKVTITVYPFADSPQQAKELVAEELGLDIRETHIEVEEE